MDEVTHEFLGDLVLKGMSRGKVEEAPVKYDIEEYMEV